ncbi:hypothetical protein [Arenimonas sp. MALMAid1274]|uniref:hypothetical protein n=1 Tax=Arenimonas sp. MALMAid1274 TaxID=3411630 RepID=UPI003BA067AD
MSAPHWLLRAAWVLLAGLLLLQGAQLVSALRYLAGPDAFAVSPLLLAALSFKALLAAVNLALLIAVHVSLRRQGTTGRRASADLSSSDRGTSP